MPLRAPPCAASPVLTDPLQEVYETAIDLHLSTADRHAVGIHPRVNIESAGWVNIGSAPTLSGFRAVYEERGDEAPASIATFSTRDLACRATHDFGPDIRLRTHVNTAKWTLSSPFALSLREFVSSHLDPAAR